MDRKKKKTSTVQGRDTPVPVVEGVRAGQPQPSSSYCVAPLLFQGETASMVTGKKPEKGDVAGKTEMGDETYDSEENVFVRSRKMMRTPPEGVKKNQTEDGKIVLPTTEPESLRPLGTPESQGDPFSPEEDEDFISWLVTSNSGKRKRIDSPMNVSMDSNRYASVMTVLEKVKEGLNKIVNSAEGVNDETKKELMMMRDAVDKEIVETHRAVMAMERCDFGCQVEEEDIRQDISVAEVRNLMKEDMTLTELEELLKMTWPEEAYRVRMDNTRITENKEEEIAILAPYNKMVDLKITKPLIGNSRQMLEYVKGGKIKEGEIISHRTEGYAEINGKVIRDRKNIHFAGLSEREEDCFSLYQLGNKIKYKILAGETNTLHIAVMNEMETETKRKILECVYYDFDGEVVLHETKPATKNKITKKEYENEAVVIERNEHLTYAQMVTNLKGQIGHDNEITSEINGVRETRDGHLLLEMKKGSKETDKIYKRIKENMKDATVKKYTGGRQKISANIYGIDIDVRENQIEERIHEVLGIAQNKDGVEIKALRPLRGGRQAATIVGKEEIISKLIETRKIKIGFSIADVKERKITNKCNRCWEIGHMAKECKGEDRSTKCRNCGKDGHLVRDCIEEPYCMVCLETGHRTESRNCKRKSRQ